MSLWVNNLQACTWIHVSCDQVKYIDGSVQQSRICIWVAYKAVNSMKKDGRYVFVGSFDDNSALLHAAVDVWRVFV